MSARARKRGGGKVLGVLVPCRDEARVIERKLRNLALARWPPAARAHRLVVVDDHSSDGTAAVAERVLAQAFAANDPVCAEVVPSRGRPGKNGALETGLAVLAAGRVDLVVLTDADVVLEPDALLALCEAFERDPRLVLASGAQRFVRELAGDGTLRAPGGGALRSADTLYDRATSLVRRLESRGGRVFSVHGQLLAWRAAAGLVPRPGIAADDLELMLAARRHDPRARVGWVAGARFFELRPVPDVARAQAVRRARAFVQFARERREEGRRHVGPLRWSLYTLGAGFAPEIAGSFSLAAVAAGAFVAGGPGATAAAVALAAACATPVGRATMARFAAIRRARALEARQTLGERWEMARR